MTRARLRDKDKHSELVAKFPYAFDKNGKLLTDTRSIPVRVRLLGFSSYKEYLLSSHWKEFKTRYIKTNARIRNLRKKYHRLVCEFCFEGEQQLEVHHKTYKNMGKESTNDVFLVCRSCHQGSHAFAALKGLALGTRTKKRIENKKAYQTAYNKAISILRKANCIVCSKFLRLSKKNRLPRHKNPENAYCAGIGKLVPPV